MINKLAGKVIPNSAIQTLHNVYKHSSGASTAFDCKLWYFPVGKEILE